MWSKLGKDLSTIEADKYNFYNDNDKRQIPQIVQWRSMDPMEQLTLKLTDITSSRQDFNPKYIAYIQSIYTGDYFQVKFQFGSKLVVGLKNSDKIKWDMMMTMYPLVNA